MLMKLINSLRGSYWKIFKPIRIGVKCLVRNEGKFLLIQNSYGDEYWTIPGGGVKRGESTEDAAIRELNEEVGIKANNLMLIGTYKSEHEGKKDTIYCYFCDLPEHAEASLKSKEVRSARWLPEDEWPREVSLALRNAHKFLENKKL